MIGPSIVLLIGGLLVGALILGVVAFVLSVGMRQEVVSLSRRVDRVVSQFLELKTSLASPMPAPSPAAPEEADEAVSAAPPEPVADAEVTEVGPPEPEGEALAGAGKRDWGALLDRMAERASKTPRTRASESDWARLEEALGTRWLTWAGVLALFFALAFAVKYAFERGWITPPMRVGLGVSAGLALLVLGELAVRKSMRAFGQALMGGGLAMLYASLFAAFAVYDVMPQKVAFAAMVLVTAGGMTLSVRHDALPISFLALLGGVLTPVLLSTGVDARDELFTYLLLLDLGVLAVALFRRWRALDVLAFIGTGALFAGWAAQFYGPEAMVPAALWVGAFYLVFLVLPFVQHLRHRTAIAPERVAMAVGNAILAFLAVYAILGTEHRHVLGFIAMAMSACYVLLAVLIRRRIPEDSQGFVAMSALAVALLSIALPLHFKLEALALTWAAEAPLLVYLGYRYRHRPLRGWAVLPLIAAAIRVATLDGPARWDLVMPIWNPLFGTAMAVAVAAWVFALIHQLNSPDATPIDHALKRSAAIVGGLWVLLYVQADIGRHFEQREQHYLARCALPAVWAAGALAYLGTGLRLRSAWALRAGLLPLAVACALGVQTYVQAVPEGYALLLSWRFAAALFVVAAVFCHGLLLRRFRERCGAGNDGMGTVLLWSGAAALLALLSAEAYCWCMALPVLRSKADWIALMSLSVVWGVYATVMLTAGFWRRYLPLRMAALGLFAATALKLVVVDMIGIRQVYRIISFLLLGVLMVGAAYAYHRVERKLGEGAEPDV